MKNKHIPPYHHWPNPIYLIISSIWVGLFLLFVNQATSQVSKPLRQFKFDHLTVKDGLSHPVVRCILQDQRGFLWFATDNGLDRYDGYGIKVFPEKEDTTLLSASIRCILESSDGNIWIGSRKGLHVFDPVTNGFERLAHVSKGKSSNDVFSLLEGKNGLLWVAP